MKNIWNIHKYESQFIEKIENQFGVSNLLANYLVFLGKTDFFKIKNYLYPDSLLRSSPFLFTDMRKAVEKIRFCIDNKNPVFIYGDKDIDGITGCATFVNFLRKFDIPVYYTIPLDKETYGFSERLFESVIKSNCKLLITVDVGIKENDYIEKLKTNNVEVIITDHHEPPEKLPDAYSIINPKCKNKYSSDDRNLSGCTVAFKVCEAVLMSFWNDLDKKYLCAVYENGGIRSAEVTALGVNNLLSGKITDYNLNQYDGIIIYKKDFKYFKELSNNLIIIEDLLKEIIVELKDIDDIKIVKSFSNQFSNDLKTLYKAFIKLQRILLPSIQRYFEDFIDLAAISTICDIMPLSKENRMIVKEGIKYLNKNTRSGIDALLSSLFNFYYNQRIDEKVIGELLSPILNSAGRLGKAQIALDLLLDEKKNDISENVKKLNNMNKERKNMGKEAFEHALETIGEKPQSNFILYRNDDIVSGITGILANKLAQNYLRPAFIFTQEAGTDIISGSARSYNNLNILKYVNLLEKYFLNFGGHEQACGFTFKIENYETIINNINEFASELNEEIDFINEIEIISEINLFKLTLDELKNLYLAGPFGVDNPKPIFIVRNQTIDKFDKIGNPAVHAKFSLRGNTDVTCLGWSLAGKIEKLKNQNKNVDIVFEPEINYFRGKENVQLMIKDVNISHL